MIKSTQKGGTLKDAKEKEYSNIRSTAYQIFDKCLNFIYINNQSEFLTFCQQYSNDLFAIVQGHATPDPFLSATSALCRM